MKALIMAGGSGKRFWPLSTREHPKQLLSLVSKKPLNRGTIDNIVFSNDSEYFTTTVCISNILIVKSDYKVLVYNRNVTNRIAELSRKGDEK